jgi:hypothetical protein
VITGLHILLTYACTSECDHCFLHCGPGANGTFTSDKLRRVFDEAERIGTIEVVYFEGGEPFLYYPLLVEGLRLASARGLKSGIVTNAYWATSVEDAKLWLRPVQDLGVHDLSISDDLFHQPSAEHSTARLARIAAAEIGLPSDTICIEAPEVLPGQGREGEKGRPVIGGSVRFRGRAAEKLTADLPRVHSHELTTCPDEDLERPERLHLDAYGNVHICQGVSMGNMWKTPLSELVRGYRAETHPICGPLSRGGPARLALEHGISLPDSFVSECHCCYTIRKRLVDKFPEYLAPKQVYGLEQ